MYQLETAHPLTEETWDLSYLKAIHDYIFQDIYAFAGEVCDEQIAKGGFQFASPLYIEEQAKELLHRYHVSVYAFAENYIIWVNSLINLKYDPLNIER